MFRKLAATVVAALTLIAATGVHAVTIRGVDSCGEWVEVHKSSAPSIGSVTAERWVVGYLSGVATGTGKEIIKGADNDSIFLFITNYCRANPLDNVADASGSLMDELIRRKGL
ncbi:hypothetical protein [Paraburkholderia unamae]|uniref:hypothetical protein n=1 Tax=Paraburkholderia unamae TaxID=219649 RepID=UPI001CC47380|nr:hypothetical protein [Paraburkholderia unamae]